MTTEVLISEQEYITDDYKTGSNDGSRREDDDNTTPIKVLKTLHDTPSLRETCM